MEEKKWSSVEEVHSHAQDAIGKLVKSLVTETTLQKYFDKPDNKGWIGNAIERDWFGIPNNSRHEADIPYLGLEIKVTPIRNTRNGWSAKERLVLNIFDFKDEYKRDFERSSFIEKANLIELIYYEYIKGKIGPEFFITAATLFDLKKLPKEDILIIKQDWEIIVNKIKEGKAEELSDSLTKYLGATTKGSKTEKNMTSQPFSDKKAHRRSFTLKGAYMSEVARKVMAGEHYCEEKIIEDIDELEVKLFEDIVLEKFKPHIGKTKVDLAKKLGVDIPKKDDKASSAVLAKKMLNLQGDIEDTEEFKKADISVKIVTVDAANKKTTEGFKIIIPGQSVIDPAKLYNEKWEESSLREYLSSYQFLLVIFERTTEAVYFRGAKFWHVPYDDLEGEIKQTWEEARDKLMKGVRLEYKKLNKPTKTGKLYEVTNDLPGMSSGEILHVRPSAKVACYYDDPRYAMKLPAKSNWINRPESTDWEEGRKPAEMVVNELSDEYMTKQAWWLNRDYMYYQVQEFFE